MPHSEARWDWLLPPHVPRGPDLGAMFSARSLLHWPRELLGIEWLGEDAYTPPSIFVVGRSVSDAWIVDMVPEPDEGEVKIVLGWDANRIDPLSCVIDARVELDGAVLLSSHLRISDLPSRDAELIPEPRNSTWSERTVTVGLPRGPEGTAWGAALYAPDGRLLDERRTGRRIERIRVSVGRSPPPVPEPDRAALQRAAQVARDVMKSAREAAAHRRLSDAGDLQHYLRWRFSCVAGELLLLDVYLLDPPVQPTVAFLQSLDRPIRALCRRTSVQAGVTVPPGVDVRLLPNGPDTLHDRVWIVGETGLLLGGSLNTFLTVAKGAPATTVTELPVADVLLWRQMFERWWPSR